MKRFEKIMTVHAWVFSILVTTVLFLLFNILATPLLNSGDDTYFMYMLGGGYGEAPTHLLHYNNGWHPALGWVVSGLFKTAPGINWYTVFLLLLHFAGAASLLYVLIKRMNRAMAVFFFLAFFLFIEVRQLLSFTFTGAALVAATGGLCLLIHQLSINKSKGWNTCLALVLLLLAGLLRLQVAWLVIAFSVPVAFTILHRRQLIQFGVYSALAAMLLLGLNQFQQYYYRQHIPGWNRQEQFRQNLFKAYNKQGKETIAPGTFTDSTEQALFYAGFLYDTTKFTPERIKSISSQITRNRSITNKEDVKGLYWFFIEMRVYLLLFAAVVAMLLLDRQHQAVKKWLLPLASYLGIHGLLFIYLKITMPLHLGLLMLLWMALAMQVKEMQSFFKKRVQQLAAAGIFIALTGWMSTRLYKENEINTMRKEKFACSLNELHRHADKLFVATNDYFPINYFYTWYVPAQYPATNLLYKDRLITFTCTKTLQRFGITSLDSALVFDNHVFLLGKPLPALENGKYPARLIDSSKRYQCLQVYRLAPVR